MAYGFDDAIKDLKEQIDDLVKNGFYVPDEVELYALDYFTGEFNLDLLRSPAKELTRQAFEARRAEQATWPEITDCDRLDIAFAELEERGIISRQNFSCCGSCGSVEIGEPVKAAIAEGKKIRGYTFYHQQDTDSAVEGYGICLNYGAIDGSRRGAQDIAHEIVAMLCKHGLTSEWIGPASRRVCLL